MFNMAKNQKSYTPEFKQQIIDLYHQNAESLRIFPGKLQHYILSSPT